QSEGKLAESEQVHRQALAVWGKPEENETPPVSEWKSLTRILIAQRKFGGAEQLLNEALTPAFVRQPSSAKALDLHADLFGRHGQWQKAAADAARAMEHDPLESSRYSRVAALFLRAHDQPAYQRLCKRLLERFANTSNPFVADEVAKSCLFAPSSETDL